MIVTTTNTIEGHAIREYCGIVFGEVITGVNMFRDIGASFTNLFGGRSAGYEDELLAAADCIARGLTECPSMPHRETLHIMAEMDCLRAQMAVRYPCESL